MNFKNMKNKFNKSESKVLTQIYRCLNYFHGGNVEHNLMVMLYPTEYMILSKYDLIKPYSTTEPRVQDWYNLTENGKKFFSNYITPERLSEELNLSIFEGKMILEFNKGLL